MAEEKIIEKIRKTLALSKNNPSEEEGKTAALMAQKLLAKYHISIAEIEETEQSCGEEITEAYVDVPAKKWKYRLAQIIAKNFCCRVYVIGSRKIAFYGHSTDVETAAEVYEMLFKLGDRKANYARSHNWGKTKSLDNSGVYNSYVMGFCKGIEDALNEQCTALALVVPEDVDKAFKEHTAGMGKTTSRVGGKYVESAYNDGHSTGYDAMSRKKLGE